MRRGRNDRVTRRKLADLELDSAARRVTRGGREVELTAKEFDLLEYLMRFQGKTVSREMLARDVWHVSARATPMDNVIDVHVARLRRKIDDSSDVSLLRTIRGVGFLLGGDPQ